jgi:oxygen-dependent protoporphyrinogen oxidase
MTVGVVGAGITGLALVHHLRERGVDVVAFEASDRPGGVIRSGRVDGRLLEYGPQRVRLTDGIADLVDAAGLRDELVAADDDLPLYVYADGRLGEVPRSLRAFVRTDLLSVRGKLRLLAEPLTAPGRPEETAAELFTRKFGPEAYRKVIGPLFGGIYGSDPARMPAEHSLSGLMRLEDREGSLLRAALDRIGSDDAPSPISFRDGLGRLPEALYERHADAIELETPVRSIAPVGGDGYELSVGGETVAVDDVVITARADRAADLLSEVTPASAEALRRLHYNPLAFVHLRADLDRGGFGYQVARGEGLRTLGVSWNASLFDRDGVYTCFLGGMENPGLVDADAAELGRIATEEFRRVAGVEAEVLDVTRYSRAFPAYDASWAALSDVTLPDGITLATNYTARMGVPSRVREAGRLAGELAKD